MKKNYILALSLLCVGGTILDGSGCAQSPSSSGSGGSKGSGGSTGSGGTNGSGGNSSGSGGGSGSGSGGSDGTCDQPSLQIFPRSDTDQSWDDNDFSDVVVEGSCRPVVLNVTWPHEADWENRDPSESNREMTRFTLDSSYSSDLTGKQLNLEIELTADKRGSNATAGGYLVSLVSVSQYDMVVVGSGGSAGTAGAGGDGTAGAGGYGAGAGGAGGEGGASAAGAGGGGGRGGRGAGGRRGGGGGGRGGAAGASQAGGRGGAPDGAGGTAGGVGGTTGGSGGVGGIAGGSGGDGAGSGGTMGGSGGDSGGSGGASVSTVTAYTEAETPVENRVKLSKVGDKATLSFPLPNKTAAADSYDPKRPIKINVRVYSAFSSADTYDYLTSQFTVRKFSVTDAK